MCIALRRLIQCIFNSYVLSYVFIRSYTPYVYVYIYIRIHTYPVYVYTYTIYIRIAFISNILLKCILKAY